MTLYVDVLFAINFSMDFLSLYLSGIILHKKFYKIRLLISSTLGGLYGVIGLLFDFNIFLSTVISIFISALMCQIAFKQNKITSFISLIVLFWGTSASLGGIMSLIYGFINKIFYEYIESYSYTEIYSGARFLIIVSLSLLFALTVSKMFSSKLKTKVAEVKIEYKNSIYNLKGICDSGNLLKEPLSGKSVILVVRFSQFGKVIENEKEFKKRYIPYSTVNGEGILKGIVPDKVFVNNNEVTAIIAPIEQKIHDDFEAIVPSSLI